MTQPIRQTYMRGNPKVRFNFRIDPAILTELEAEAEKSGWSLARMVVAVLEDWLREQRTTTSDG